MPIYEYECRGCGKRFEIFQKISEEPLKVCKECNGRLNRLISMCSFQLRGSGWYVTDYKSSGPGSGGNGPRPEKKEEETEKKAGTKVETKGETVKGEAAGGAP